MLEAQMHRNFWEFRNLTVKIFKLSPVCLTSTPMFGSQLHQTALKGISNACYDIFIDHFHSSNEKRSLKQWACSFYFASSLKSAADQSSEAPKMVLVTFRRQAGKQLYKQLPDAFYYPRIQFFNFTADSSMCFFVFAFCSCRLLLFAWCGDTQH